MRTITATPYATPYGRLWLIECSDCGPLGVAEDAVCTLLMRDHAIDPHEKERV